LADIVREQIIEEVKSAKYFSLVFNESKDVSKQEQNAIVLRFLTMALSMKLDAKSLSTTLIDAMRLMD